MRAEGSRSPRSLLVFVIIVIIVVDRAQEMGKDPLGHVASLPSSLQVRKAEMDTCVDAGVEYVRGGIREAVIGTCRRGGGRMVRSRYGEGHFVGPKEESETAGYGAGDVVGS